MFVKIFSQIFDSSIAEDPKVRHIFMDLLLLADREGVVDSTVSAIARRTCVPKEDVEYAISVLSRPDPESRSKAEQGRRLVMTDPARGWGWKIVNYLEYRGVTSEEGRREYFREQKRISRVRKKEAAPVKDSQRQSKTVKDKSALSKMSTHAEAEAEAKGEATVAVLPHRGEKPPPHPEMKAFIDDWCSYYERYTRKPGEDNGEKYPFQAKDAKAALALLKYFGTAQAAKDFIKAIHARRKEGFPFGNTMSLTGILSGLPALIEALKSAPRINGRPVVSEADRVQAATGIESTAGETLKRL